MTRHGTDDAAGGMELPAELVHGIETAVLGVATSSSGRRHTSQMLEEICQTLAWRWVSRPGRLRWPRRNLEAAHQLCSPA